MHHPLTCCSPSPQVSLLLTVNEAVDGLEESDVVGELLGVAGRRAQHGADDVVLLLHQLLAVELLLREGKRTIKRAMALQTSSA